MKRRLAISRPPIIVGSLTFLPSGLWFLSAKLLPALGIAEGILPYAWFGKLKSDILPQRHPPPIASGPLRRHRRRRHHPIFRRLLGNGLHSDSAGRAPT